MIELLPRRLAALVSAVEGLRLAYFFGSRAEGVAVRPDSDLDLAVAYDRHLDAWGREQARRAVVATLTDELGQLGEKADVVDIERCALPVAFRIVRDGIPLFERQRSDRLQLHSRIARMYDDQAPTRRLFERSLLRQLQSHG